MSPHQKTEESIAALAIGADDDADARREAMDHIAGCEDCRALYRDLRDTAGELALAAEPLAISEGFERRVLDAARASERTDAPVGAPPKARRRSIAAIVAVAAAVAMLGGATIQLADQLSDERARADRIQAASALLSDPDARRFTMDERNGDGRMTLAVAADGNAVLVGTGLTLPADHVFEIWLIRGTDLVPGEVFTVEDGTAIVPLRLKLNRDVGVAITIERHRVEEPTTQPVFQSDLSA